MAKIKNASFGIETRTTAADSVLESFVPPTTASRGSGGRPVDDRLNSFIVQRVLQFYVDFLKMKAPKHWNERNINFALFSPEIPKREQSNRSPYSGIAAILKRKSLPRLGQDDRVSRAILLAEETEMFVGGFQILFHPYVSLLHMPTELGSIRDLLFNCSNTFSLGFARHTPWGDRRNQRSFQEESLALENLIAQSRQDESRWLRTFLDLIAVALGLTLESGAIGDSNRLRAWRKWWDGAHLKFADWPVGDTAPRITMDRWISLQVEQLELPYRDPVLNGSEYLVAHVIALDRRPDGNSSSDELQPPPSVGFSVEKLVWIFLSLRDGTKPSERDVSTILLGATEP
jgi:hypothetical protein